MRSTLHWHPSPAISEYFNMASVKVPIFEKFIIETCEETLEKPLSGKSTERLKKIITQEHNHTVKHEEINRAVPYRRFGDAYFYLEAMFIFTLIRFFPFKARLACALAVEKVAQLLSVLILKLKWINNEDCPIQSVWMAHFIEELDHHAILDEAYKELYPIGTKTPLFYSLFIGGLYILFLPIDILVLVLQQKKGLRMESFRLMKGFLGELIRMMRLEFSTKGNHLRILISNLEYGAT